MLLILLYNLDHQQLLFSEANMPPFLYFPLASMLGKMQGIMKRFFN